MTHAHVRLGKLALAVVLVLAPTVLLAAPSPPPKPKPDSAAEKVKKALDQPIDFDGGEVDITLGAAINLLHEQTKIKFTFDTVAMASLGIVPDSIPVSAKKQSAKARAVLRSLLTQGNLSYAIVGDGVLISTEDMALNRQLKQHITLDVDKKSLAAVLDDLSRETTVKILIDKKMAKAAQEEVSLQVDDVPFDAAVRLVCEQTSLKPVRIGNVLYVTSKENAKELRSEPDLAPAAPAYPGGLDGVVPAGPGVGGPAGGIGIALPVTATPATPPVPMEVSKPADDKKEEKK